MDKLVSSGEMDTAFYWASLQPTAVRDKILQYLTTHDHLDPGSIPLKVAQRPLVKLGTDINDHFRQ
jgi:hypothetical protein